MFICVAVCPPERDYICHTRTGGVLSLKNTEVICNLQLLKQKLQMCPYVKKMYVIPAFAQVRTQNTDTGILFED